MKKEIEKNQVKIINVKLPTELHQKFKILVAAESIDMQKKTLHLIADFINKKEAEQMEDYSDDY